MVPRAGVEPARPYGQRILSLFRGYSPQSTTRYQIVFTDVSAVKASYVWLRTNTYPPRLPLITNINFRQTRRLESGTGRILIVPGFDSKMMSLPQKLLQPLSVTLPCCTPNERVDRHAVGTQQMKLANLRN
jgi:hypothetical protein